MTLLQHHMLACGLTSVSTFGLGLLVFLSDPKKRINHIFGFYSLCISLWAVIEISVVGANDLETAKRFIFLFWPPILFIPSTFLHTVLLLTNETGATSKKTLKTSYLLSCLFLIAHIFFNALNLDPRLVGYVSYYTNLSGVGMLAGLQFFFVINFSLWKLYAAHRGASGQKKIQIKYLFWSSLLGYVGGSPDWALAFGYYIPFLNPFGIYAIPLYSIATSYAILQHRLFDINLVVRKSLIYSILVTILTIGYFGFVYGLELIFRVTFGYSSFWLSVAAFAAMALLFQPLKISIQRLVDLIIFRVPQEQLAKKMERLEQEAREAEKMRAASTMAAGLCHELRNPLQAIQTYSEFLPVKYDDPEFRKNCMEAMRTEITRINEMLKQLMDFAKPKTPTLQVIEPHKVLDSTLDLLSNEFIKKQIKFTKYYTANGAWVKADPDQLRQVILNLALNAIQAVAWKGRITVTMFGK